MAGLPATSLAFLGYIALGLLALGALLVFGLGGPVPPATWAAVLLGGVLVVALIVALVRRKGDGLAREP